MRQVAVPEALRLVDTPFQVIEVCASLSSSAHLGKVVIVSTPTPYDIVGRHLERELSAEVVLIRDNTYRQVQEVSERLFAGNGTIVIGLGGGKAIDVAKLAAHYSRCRFISVPTQVSHDGLASPVAVISHPSRGVISVGAATPEAVIVPMDIVRGAPSRTVCAGIGDLLAKLTALRDWRLAVQAGQDEFDDYAAMLAEASLACVYPYLMSLDCRALNSPCPEFLSRLIHGLLLSGIAMGIAGSSRPCSGSEHLISHAIDRLFGGRALHGEQVALGTLVSLVVHGQASQASQLARVYRELGLPTHWEHLGLADGQFLSVLCEAPRTRPDRYTVLSKKLPTESMLVEIAAALGKGYDG